MRTPQHLLDAKIRAMAATLDANADDDVLAARCLLAGVFSDDDLQAMVHEELCHELEDALSALDEEGLPYAGPTRKLDDDGQAMWIARERWDSDDAAYNLAVCVQKWGAEHPRTTKLRDYIADRFGKAEEDRP